PQRGCRRGGTWVGREQRFEARVRLLPGDERLVVADERHLPVVEVAQRHAAEVELPDKWVRLFLDFAVKLPLSGGWRRHHVEAWPGRFVDDRAEVRFRRDQTRLEQPQAEGMVIVSVVAVIEARIAAYAPPGETSPAAELIEAPLGLGVDQMNPRLVDLLD